MSSKKDKVVNKAIIFTRKYRPIFYDEVTGKPNTAGFHIVKLDEDSLLDLCKSIEEFLYEDDDGK